MDSLNADFGDQLTLVRQPDSQAANADAPSGKRTTYEHKHVPTEPIFTGTMKVVNPNSPSATSLDLTTLTTEQLFTAGFYDFWSAASKQKNAYVFPTPPDYDGNNQLQQSVSSYIQGSAAAYTAEADKPIRLFDIFS